MAAHTFQAVKACGGGDIIQAGGGLFEEINGVLNPLLDQPGVWGLAGGVFHAANQGARAKTGLFGHALYGPILIQLLA